MKPVKPEGADVITYAICGYCRNRGTDSCLTECRKEGLYRYLEPIALEEFDNPPEIPSMNDLLSYDAVSRLAFIRLSLHYLREFMVQAKPPLYDKAVPQPTRRKTNA